jgi:hypothetical protein
VGGAGLIAGERAEETGIMTAEIIDLATRQRIGVKASVKAAAAERPIALTDCAVRLARAGAVGQIEWPDAQATGRDRRPLGLGRYAA